MSQFPPPSPPPLPPNGVTSSYGGPLKLSSMALTAMILGIIGLVICPGMGIVALILGIISLNKINRQPQAFSGKGFAITGIATGAASLLFLPLMIAILLPSLSKARGRAQTVICLSNLRQIGLATSMYESDNNGNFPGPGSSIPANNDWIYWQNARDKNQGALIPYMGGHFNNKIFTCPGDPQGRPANNYQYSYSANVNVFILEAATSPGIPSKPLRVPDITTPSFKIMLVERAGFDDAAWEPQNWTPGGTSNILSDRHDKNKSNVEFLDGHAESVPITDAMTPHFYDPLAR